MDISRVYHAITLLSPSARPCLRLLSTAFEEGPAPWYGKLIAAAGVILLAWLGFIAWRGKDDFRITVRRGRVHFRGRFPPGRRSDTADFLLREVAAPGVFRVIGNWNSQRILRIAVQGNISDGQRQRIRNFMKITLKG
ncbi:MAG TPA: hypothetical protein VFC78_13280 [Tepidisphaeraceae bacterium]|nr:hypothetical protein [Tepidisphaeraceae bacterium]